MGKLLVIDDDPDLAVLLEAILRTAGHHVTVAHTAADAVELARGTDHDLLLIDLGLPDGDGKDAVRRIRATSNLPIIVVTARHEVVERVSALDAGADDFVLKPFEGDELAARVRAQLRRVSRPVPPEATLEFDRLTIEPAGRRVELHGLPIHFTPTELQMLVLLAGSGNRLVTHSELYREVWPDGSAESGHYVRVYIQQIRRKLRDNPADPSFIATELSHGYRWLPEAHVPQHSTS